MAAPVKNLVDATSPSRMATVSYTPRYRNVVAMLSQYTYSVQIETPIPRYTIVSVSTPTISQIPLVAVGLRTKEAGMAAIKTFSAIYRERVSSRPTEGQIFPRGFN